jgi:hypothetical protein
VNSLNFIFGAVLLLGLAWLLTRNTEPYCDCGPEGYQWRRRRRLVGNILLVMAGLAFIIAALGFIVSAAPDFTMHP